MAADTRRPAEWDRPGDPPSTERPAPPGHAEPPNPPELEERPIAETHHPEPPAPDDVRWLVDPEPLAPDDFRWPEAEPPQVDAPPAEPEPPLPNDPPVDLDNHLPPASLPPARPVVVVVGLGPRCGASTVARWLAAALALRDPDGGAVVVTPAPRGTGALRTSSAARLARALEARSVGPARAAGRVCLLDSDAHSPLTVAATYLAPVVVDLPHGASPDAALSVADQVLLVAAPAAEPALATVVAESLARSGPEPTIVLNRALEEPQWDRRADVVLADSRMAARRAAAGREARGPVGVAVDALAEEIEASLWE